MGGYFDKQRGHWFYRFALRGTTHKQRGFQTKREALEAEHEKRRELGQQILMEETGTACLLEVANKYLDFCKASK